MLINIILTTCEEIFNEIYQIILNSEWNCERIDFIMICVFLFIYFSFCVRHHLLGL